MNKQMILFLCCMMIFATTSPRLEYGRRVTIQTPTGDKLPCDENSTPESVFQHCRRSGSCIGDYGTLKLLLGGLEIKEGTPCADRPFNRQRSSDREGFIVQDCRRLPAFPSREFRPRNVYIQTPSGETLSIPEDSTPAQAFAKCRRQRECVGSHFKIGYGNRVISEDSPQANRSFADLDQNLHSSARNPAIFIQRDSSTSHNNLSRVAWTISFFLNL